MKKILLFAIMAAVLGFTACSKEEPAQPETIRKGMVLHATVSQSDDTRASFTDKEGVWHFDYTERDQITVTNKNIDTYYTFTYNGTDFISTDAEPTSKPARWYAYYPSKDVSFVGQTGKWDDLANVYALVGSTTYGKNVTGEDGLNITMYPKCAVLKIINQKGSIDINVKHKDNGYWIKGLTDSQASFVLSLAETKQTFLSTTEIGTYYIAVPAGTPLTVYDGDKVIRSTSKGLTAGNYYELTISVFGQGFAEAKDIGKVKWIQLWKDGPKYAEYNVKGQMTFTDAVKAGEDYVWGGNWCTPSYDELNELLLAAQGNSKAKVTCVYGRNEEGAWGFTFTGKEAGYADNSVFFPAGTVADSGLGFEWYWSSTKSSSEKGWLMTLAYDKIGRYQNMWDENLLTRDYCVRPVLKPETTGIAKANIRNKQVDVKWVQLWGGGLKFAEYNMGVIDGKAESCGEYCTWDDQKGTQWGSNWRLPTKEDFDKMFANCTCTWTTQNGVNGLLCTGNVYSDNSIFLPAAGYTHYGGLEEKGTNGYYWYSPIGDPSRGLYFDSNGLNREKCLYYSHGDVQRESRYNGYSVRAVLNE